MVDILTIDEGKPLKEPFCPEQKKGKQKNI
jgi:hypothetical protein